MDPTLQHFDITSLIFSLVLVKLQILLLFTHMLVILQVLPHIPHNIFSLIYQNTQFITQNNFTVLINANILTCFEQ